MQPYAAHADAKAIEGHGAFSSSSSKQHLRPTLGDEDRSLRGFAYLSNNPMTLS